MATTSTWYATREDVRSALDAKTTARDDTQIARALEAASRDADTAANYPAGAFRPQTATRYFSWPPDQASRSWRLWLDANPLISATTITSGGTTIAAADYYLEPATYGPPYDRVEIDLSSSAAWSSGDTHQRAVSILGLWGHSDTQTTAGTLNGGINASVTTLVVSDGSLAGVGDHLVIDSERVVVTGRTYADSTVNLGGSGLTALASDTAVTVTGTWAAGEVLQIDAERMLVTSTTATGVVVVRAYDGTVLAAHSAAADVYVNRTLTVERGAQGSTAASHSNGAAIARHVVPPAVHAYTVAAALAQLGGEQAGYRAETASSSGRPASPPAGSLDALRGRVCALHGRVRTRAV